MSKIHKTEAVIQRVSFTPQEIETCRKELIDFSYANKIEWLLSKKVISFRTSTNKEGKKIYDKHVIMLKNGSIPYTAAERLWEAVYKTYNKMTKQHEYEDTSVDDQGHSGEQLVPNVEDSINPVLSF